MIRVLRIVRTLSVARKWFAKRSARLEHMMSATKPPTPLLRRDLGLLDAVAVGLGAVIGAGLFVVTGQAAAVAGPGFVVGLGIAGVAAACNALSSAELAAKYPQAGGTYEYGYQVLHPLAGFSAGWMFLASKLAAGGTVALGFAGYVNRFLPEVPPRLIAVSAVVVLTLANLVGIRKAGQLNTVIVSFTVLSLLVFVAVGLPHFRVDHWEPFLPHGPWGLAEATAMLFFAYTGYARLATLGEEVREPRRTIPLAITITVGFSALLYSAVGIVAVGAVGAPGLGRSNSPLETAAAAFETPGMVELVGLGASTAMLGVLLSQILGISRMLFALARRRDLPAVLGRVHPVTGVPDVGVVLTGVIISGLAAFGELKATISTAAFTILLYYAITNSCALRMPRSDQLFPRWVAILGLLSCLGLAMSLRWETVALGLGLLGVGLVLRVFLHSPPQEG